MIVPNFVSQIPRNWREDDDAVISNAALMYRVSRLVILLRLVEAGLATEEYLQSKWPLLRRRPKKPDREKQIVPPYRRALSRNGESFVRLAMSAYQEGEIHGGQLYDLLHIKMQYLPTLEREIYKSRVLS
jgi:Zn-dependent peptidase ImmA (M78 family)